MTHIVKRSMSLLLAVLFCLSLVTLPVLAIEGEDQQPTSTTESTADQDPGDATNGDGSTAPTEQSPVNPNDGENQENPDANNAQNTDQGEEEHGANSTTEGNGDDKEQDGDENGDGNTPVNPGDNEGEDKAPVPEGFFTGVDMGRDYQDGHLIPFGNDVAKDSGCALLFNYKIPDDSMKTGTVYTFSFKAPLALEAEFTIYDGSTLVARGTITPNGDGTVSGKLTFIEQEYLKEGTTGYFYVYAGLDESKIPSEGRQNVTIEVVGGISHTVSIDFAAPVADADVDLQKTSKTAKADADDFDLLANHQIEWTLTVTPSVTNQPEGEEHINSLVVTDKITENGLTYVAGSATVTSQDLSISSEELLDMLSYDDATGVLTFTGRDKALKKAAWPITIKFKTQYDLTSSNLPVKNGNLTYTNEATAIITAPQYEKDADGKVELKDNGKISKDTEASNTAQIAYLSMTKEGSLESGNHVSWELKVRNPFQQENPYVVDKLPAHMQLKGDVKLGDTVLPKRDASDIVPSYAYDTESNTLTIYLPQNEAGEQTITYETEFIGIDAKDVYEVVNNADFYVGNGKNPVIHKEAKVNIGNALMSKWGTYDPKTHRISWKIEVRSDGMNLTNIKLKDTFAQTPVDQTFVEDSMKIDGQSIPNTYTLKVAADKKSFELDVPVGHNRSAIITYETELEDSINGHEFWGSNRGNFSVKNTITLEADGLPPTAEVTATTTCTSRMLKKEAVSYDYTDKTITWKLTVNDNQMALKNGQIVDTLEGLDWAYDQIVSIQQDGRDLNGWKVTYSENKKTMTIGLPDLAEGSKAVIITYKTKLVNDNALLLNGKLTAKNNATLTGDQVGTNVTASAAQEVGKSVLDKQVSQNIDADHQLEWTVDVNRNLTTIQASEGANIGILDTLQDGLSYVKGSLNVYPLSIAANGDATPGAALEEGKDYTVTYDKATRELQILWNQNTLTTAYRVTFKTLVMVSGTYSNTVHFVGVTTGNWNSSQTGGKQITFGGGATSLPESLGELVIEKKDGTDQSTPLAGTRFEVIDGDIVLATVTTNDQGKATLILPVGTYTIQEIGTSNGYVLKSQKETTWQVEVKKKESVTLTAYNYLDKNMTSYSPKVTKELKGRTTSTEKFTFKLEAVDNAPMPDDNATVTLDGVTGVAETDTVSFGQIQYTAPGTYEYTITEEDGKASRYTYDTKPHTLTVTVEYVTGTDETKRLTVTSAKYDTDQDSLTITNTYKKPSGGGGTVTPDPKPDPDPVPPLDPVDPVDPKPDPDPDQPTEPTEPDKPTEPDQPSEPEQPSQPETPSRPNRPSRPDIPQYPIDRLPDPSDPNSPDEIIIIDDDDVPLGNFYKEQEPDGSYAYVDKKGHMYGRTMPKGTQSSGRTPQTGVPMTVPALAITGGLCAVGGAVLCFGGKKKKDEA